MLETIELKRQQQQLDSFAQHTAFNVIGFFVELQIRIKWNTHTFWIYYWAHWLGFTKLTDKKTHALIAVSRALHACVRVCHLRFYVFRALILRVCVFFFFCISKIATVIFFIATYILLNIFFLLFQRNNLGHVIHFRFDFIAGQRFDVDRIKSMTNNV